MTREAAAGSEAAGPSVSGLLNHSVVSVASVATRVYRQIDQSLCNASTDFKNDLKS